MNKHISETKPELETIEAPSQEMGQEQTPLEAAYERRLAEIEAVTEEELTKAKLDIHAAVATVVGSLPEIRALRPQMERLPDLDLALVDGLEDYALATAQANSLYATAMTPKEDIVALNETAVKLREQFRLDGHALAGRGLLDRQQLGRFKGLVGYKNVAFELIDWANLMKQAWGTIAGKSGLTYADVQRGLRLGNQLFVAAGIREQAPVVQAQATRTRLQAFTLLLRAYDETRRAVGYLRWREDDVDTIAPSLFAGRTRRHEETPETEAEANGGIVATPVVPGAPDPAAAPVPQAFPGASAFIR